MELRTWGKTGFRVPAIGEGSWQMEGDDRQACIDSLRAGIEAGLTHVDTAEIYGHGVVEKDIVAPAIAGLRDRIFLVSKVYPGNATYDGVLAACDRSLQRLQTDHLDGYLLHWPGEHPLEDTIRGFEELQKAGKIRSWGVSNFDAEELDAALAIAGEGRIACNQVLYHLEERTIEQEVVPWCEQHGVTVVGYSPFGSGRFPALGSRAGKELAAVAQETGATPRQVALAFLTRKPSLLTIPKTTRAEHARENAKAGELRLTPAQVDRIDAAFPAGEGDELPVI
jgi:diketogulonate reductase-like aldo/keto reductase